MATFRDVLRTVSWLALAIGLVWVGGLAARGVSLRADVVGNSITLALLVLLPALALWSYRGTPWHRPIWVYLLAAVPTLVVLWFVLFTLFWQIERLFLSR